MRRYVSLLAAACLIFGLTAAPIVSYAEETAVTESAEEPGDEEAGENSAMEVIANPESEGIAAPAGAEYYSENYKGSVVQAARVADGLCLLAVRNEEGGGSWYVYNKETDSFVPYMDIIIRQDNFIILPLDKGVEVPEGMNEVGIEYSHTIFPAWKHQNASEDPMFLVYGENSDGTRGFYRFDGATGLFFRYVEDATLPETTAETEPPTDDPELLAEIDKYSRSADLHQTNFDNLQAKYNKEFMMGAVALGVCGLLLVLFLILIIIQSSRLRKTKQELSDNAGREARKSANDRARAKRPESEPEGKSRRNESREDGTSQVRKAHKNTDPRLERSTTTSAARKVNKKPAEAENPKPEAADSELDESVYRPARKKRPESDTATQAIRPSDDISGTGEVRRVKKAEKVENAPAPARKASRAQQVSELDELEDVAKAVQEAVPEDDGFQAGSNSGPELDTAGLEKIAEQLKKYNLGDDLPDDDELPDLDGTDDGEDSDFAVTDFRDV